MSKRLSGVRGKFVGKSDSLDDIANAPQDTTSSENTNNKTEEKN